MNEYVFLPKYSNDNMANAILRPTNLGLVECLIEDFAAMEN